MIENILYHCRLPKLAGLLGLFFLGNIFASLDYLEKNKSAAIFQKNKQLVECVNKLSDTSEENEITNNKCFQEACVNIDKIGSFMFKLTAVMKKKGATIDEIDRRATFFMQYLRIFRQITYFIQRKIWNQLKDTKKYGITNEFTKTTGLGLSTLADLSQVADPINDLLNVINHHYLTALEKRLWDEASWMERLRGTWKKKEIGIKEKE